LSTRELAWLALSRTAGDEALLALDPGIASVLVDRALGGDGHGLETARGPLRDAELGVLSYVFARLLLDGGSSFVVSPSRVGLGARSAQVGSGDCEVWSLDLRVGASRGAAWLWLSGRGLPGRGLPGRGLPGRAPATELPRAMPSWAAALPVTLSVEACALSLSPRALAGLRAGDVVLAARTDLGRGARGLEGEVRVRAAHGGLVWRGELRGESVRLGQDEASPVTWTHTRAARVGLVRADAPRAERKDATMKDADQVLQALGDTPVALSLELARFSLPLAEVASLAPGEVLRTGQLVGSRAVLRAGERVVASGELVEVEGELGLRVLETAP
jgi:type III secretion system YscQ/HrcQ family protein